MIISVDIEADGPCPGLYSMISLGAVTENNKIFYAEIAPISDLWVPDALAVSGFSREQTQSFESAETIMLEFNNWVNEQKGRNGRALFMSDNAGFDWQFVNYYFHRFVKSNPFGFSPMSLTWFAKGLVRDPKARAHSKYRKTKHSHNALDDARGNMEAYKTLIDMYCGENK